MILHPLSRCFLDDFDQCMLAVAQRMPFSISKLKAGAFHFLVDQEITHMLEFLHIRQIPETIKTDAHLLVHHRHDDIEMSDFDQALRVDMVFPEETICRSSHTLIRQRHDKRLPVQMGKIEVAEKVCNFVFSNTSLKKS